MLAEGYNNFGIQLQDSGYPTDALRAFTHAIDVNPNYAEAYTNRGSAHYNKGDFDKAVEDHVHAIKLLPTFAIAFSNLSVVLADQGKHEAAINCLQKAIKEDPEFSVAHSNLISQMDLSVGCSVADLQAERRKWAEKHCNVETMECKNDSKPGRKLKIGYVSADFRCHSAVFVFGKMLRSYDKEQFEVFCYSNSRYEDETTLELKGCVDHWRTIPHLSDIDLAKCIQHDQIDILVDLSGHSAGNRLITFAHKPAPVQITAWGYVGGTGLKQIDAFFADIMIVPPDETHLYAEKVINLPCMVGASITEPFPPVGELPALKNGYITFGSFNRSVKNSQQSLNAWGRILASIENSHLYMNGADSATEERLLAHFEGYGIDRIRIKFKARTSWYAHMDAFNEIDICLDPYPHGGGVTTLESLMMGVPVVTYRWPSVVGRLSASILTTLGMQDWITDSEDEYVEMATAIGNGMRLDVLRSELRGKMENSIICQPGYERAVENEYRQLWQTWCSTQGE